MTKTNVYVPKLIEFTGDFTRIFSKIERSGEYFRLMVPLRCSAANQPGQVLQVNSMEED